MSFFTAPAINCFFPNKKMTKMRTVFLLFLPLAILFPAAMAQTDTPGNSVKEGVGLPEISGTLRAKTEWQTNEGASRFEVRNARVALDGRVLPKVNYRAEIDLSDEGRIRMLDAFAGIQPARGLTLRLGQMRVPFGVDAHRSPHKQYFANRSFLAKQVGDVRDAGCYAGYTFPSLPLTVEGGLYNGSGLTEQKDWWTKRLNFSVKALYALPWGLTVQASMQKVAPAGISTSLFDGSITLVRGRWMLEGEYIRKRYANSAFRPVDAVNAFVTYDLPVRRMLTNVRFLCRYDRMGDHADGKVLLAEGGNRPRFGLTDPARQRITGGVTLSLASGMNADIRLNCEKYFYRDISLAKPSERDKVVVEVVLHFPNR